MAAMLNFAQLEQVVARCEVSPLFVTVSGAHLYGFDSPDSDVDLRGCHLLPLRDVIGLGAPVETLDRTWMEDSLEIDLVSHDARKYFTLLLKNNGYVLEQIFSPLVVTGQPFLDRLKPLAAQCITRFHYHHYRGFFATQLKLLDKQQPRTAKALLYAYRVLLTGIHLLKTGRVQADIRQLNQTFGLPYIPELIDRKTQEKTKLPDLDWQFHRGQLLALEQQMLAAFEESTLPEERDQTAVNNLLVELRLGASAG